MTGKARSNTKWFLHKNAFLVQKQLARKGIKTYLVKTTKINRIDGKKRPAFLVKRRRVVRRRKK